MSFVISREPDFWNTETFGNTAAERFISAATFERTGEFTIMVFPKADCTFSLEGPEYAEGRKRTPEVCRLR